MSDYQVSIGADVKAFQVGIKKAEATFDALLTVVKKGVGARITALQTAQEDAKAASSAWFSARNELEALQSAAGSSSRDMKEWAGAIDQARSKADAARTALDQQKRVVNELRKSLQSAGVDTKNLAGEQARLAAQLTTQEEAAKRAAAEDAKRARWAAVAETRNARLAAQEKARLEAEQAPAQQLTADRNTLGIQSHVELQQRINEVRTAYERLKASGKLTGTELAQAALATETRIRELRKEAGGLADAFKDAKASLVGLGVAAAGVAAVSAAAVKFEANMADVAKVVDATDEQLSALEERFKALALEMPVEGGLGGILKIAEAGGQLGVPIEKLDEFVQLAAQMSVAFNMTAEQAGQAVAKLANVFNIPIERVGELGDAINTLGNTTAAKEADIVEVLTRIGGSATQFGLAGDNAAALAATMLSLGMSTEVAGTGINAMLTKLQTANIQGVGFQRALTVMGISANELAKNIRENPQKALTEFLGTLAKLDGQSRAETIAELFGLEYQDKISRLVAALPQYEQALARVADKTKVAGAMEREFATRAATTEAQLQLLRQSVEVLATNLGSILLPVLKPAVESLRNMTAAVAEFVEKFPEIAAIAGAVGIALTSLGALRLGFLAVNLAAKTSLAGASGALKALGVDIAAASTAVSGLTKLIPLVGAAFTGWEIGAHLRKEFAIVELAGNKMARAVTIAVETAKSGARFDFNPIDALVNREEVVKEYESLAARLKEVNRIYDEMDEDAKNRSRGAAPAAPVVPVAQIDEAKKAADELGAALTAARKAAADLGVDLGQHSQSITTDFRAQVEQLGNLIRGYNQLKTEGVDAARAVQTALSKMVADARNPAELNALVTTIVSLGKAGVIAQPQVKGLFDEVNNRAKAALAPARELKQEIDDLLRQANNIRSGVSGAGAKAQERRDRSLSDDEREALAIRRARDAIDQASRNATYAQNAALDGRAESAQRYAKIAADLIQQAAANADKIQDNDAAARIQDDIAKAEANMLEGQASAKKKQLKDIEAANAEQQAQMAELEQRIFKLRADLTGIPVKLDTAILDAQLAQIAQAVAAAANGKQPGATAAGMGAGQPAAQTGGNVQADTQQAAKAVEQVQQAVDALPKEKTVVLKTVIDGVTTYGDAAGLKEWGAAGPVTEVDVQAETAQADQALKGVQQAVDAIPAEKTVIIKTIVDGVPTFSNGQAAPAASGDVPARATGGMLPGDIRGDVSDNMLYRGTPGEYVLRRPVVRQPGMLEFLEDLNRRGLRALVELRGRMPAVPRFATGGMLGGMVGGMPPSLSAGVERMRAVSGASGGAGQRPLLLDFGALGRVQVSASAAESDSLVKRFRRASLAAGSAR